MPRSLVFLLSILIYLLSSCKPKEERPNIVIIYADDMGYGDLNCQNPDSKIPTPNLDNLAAMGMRFTDAHSSSGICSPSRFALLTGSYHWRRQHGIVGAFGEPFFHESDITLPSVLQSHGYHTACIGKWHLGWNWEFLNAPSGRVTQWGREREVYKCSDIDWQKPIAGGPLDRGFDYYFGDGTINFPPYAWVENERFIEIPTEEMEIDHVGFSTKEGQWEFRPGPKVKDWNPYTVLPTLTQKAVDWVGQQKNDHPFFLYFALPSPHAPIIPNDEFDGKSQAGAYGDFVFQTDWCVGQLLEALDKKGVSDNTIIVFSSDNGPEHYAWRRAEKFDHYSMGDFRGLKRDVWEGGHHVPMIVKWSNKINANSVSHELISQIDLMSTLSAMVNITLSEKAAPDSYDMSGRLMLGHEKKDTPIRQMQLDSQYISNRFGQFVIM